MPLKIGILSTCVGAEELYEKYASEDKQIANRLSNVRPDWCFETYRAYMGEFPDPIDACDGYVISGSPASVNARAEWVGGTLSCIRKFFSGGHPMLGICFGHQAIAKAFGGKVELAKNGWNLGSINVHFQGQAPWMHPRRNVMRMYAVHNEQVVSPPNGAEILGHTDTCPIASFRIGNHVFTTQHHPEMTVEFMTHVVDLMASELDPEIISRAKASLEFQADNDFFAQWMASFLERRHG